MRKEGILHARVGRLELRLAAPPPPANAPTHDPPPPSPTAPSDASRPSSDETSETAKPNEDLADLTHSAGIDFPPELVRRLQHAGLVT